MKVKVTMKSGAIKTLSKAQTQAASMVAHELLNRVRNDAVIPFDTGNLQNEATHVDDSLASKGTVSIVHDASYAQRVYNHPEYDFQQGKNANAGGRWWDPYLIGGMKKVPAELFRAFYKRLTGGYVK